MREVRGANVWPPVGLWASTIVLRSKVATVKNTSPNQGSKQTRLYSLQNNYSSSGNGVPCMTAAVIIAIVGVIVVGFVAGWLSCKRVYDPHLLAADKERCRLIAENRQLKSNLALVQSKSLVG